MVWLLIQVIYKLSLMFSGKLFSGENYGTSFGFRAK